MIFKTPLILFFIPVVFALIALLNRWQKLPALRFSSVNLFQGIGSSWRVRLNFLVPLLRLLSLIFLVVALAGPRKVLDQTVHKTEGIDIVLAIDVSGSMAAEDFRINGKRINRLAVVKNVVSDFIRERQSDKIGIIAFAGLAYTVCPLTTDYEWLMTNLDRVQLGLLEDGTAIGSAISSSLIRLKNSQAKSKVIILLTDGINNAGKIDPLTAAKMAGNMNVKIYTIGAGTKGLAPFPARDIFGRVVYENIPIEIDENTLQQIAQITSGKYFRATDTDSLRHVYKEIDSLEKTTIEETGYREYKELFVVFLFLALALLVIETLLSSTVFLRIPY